ncbi:MAG: metallophosphoesterase [Spirochaetes bacterium]|nr:metallophosphoesterase [Spirochaetota bacterium]
MWPLNRINQAPPLLFAVIAAALAAAACSAPATKPAPAFTFVVIGNTSPASPFTGYAEKLDQVFESINRENPVLVVHTGNLVQGGSESVGVSEKDVARQYRTFLEQKKALGPVLHIMAGEKDLYNGKADLFKKFTGRTLWYSFNYGNIHFIILHVLHKEHWMSPAQKAWLKRDLEAQRDAAAIFVFTHYPVLAPPNSGIRCVNGNDLHALFVRYPVKAVLSGSIRGLYDYEKDGVRYIAAGCFGFTMEDWHWGFNQYYVAHYDAGRLSIRGVRVNFTGPSYRPKIIRPAPAKKN